ncbi:hypothetical protein D3C81_1285920 [compost metagenome]
MLRGEAQAVLVCRCIKQLPLGIVEIRRIHRLFPGIAVDAAHRSEHAIGVVVAELLAVAEASDLLTGIDAPLQIGLDCPGIGDASLDCLAQFRGQPAGIEVAGWADAEPGETLHKGLLRRVRWAEAQDEVQHLEELQ